MLPLAHGRGVLPDQRERPRHVPVPLAPGPVAAAGDPRGGRRGRAAARGVVASAARAGSRRPSLACCSRSAWPIASTRSGSRSTRAASPTCSSPASRPRSTTSSTSTAPGGVLAPIYSGLDGPVPDGPRDLGRADQLDAALPRSAWRGPRRCSTGRLDRAAGGAASSRSTGARFLFADCLERADLSAGCCGPTSRSVRRFGCATVYELDRGGAAVSDPAPGSPGSAAAVRRPRPRSRRSIMLKGMQPNDEGLMLQAASRIADGEVPYRDFWWFYPPGQPYLLAGLWKLFGAVAARLADPACAHERRRGAARLPARAPRGPARARAAGLGGGGRRRWRRPPARTRTRWPSRWRSAACSPSTARPSLAGVLVGVCALWRIEFAAYLGRRAWCSATLLRPGPGGPRDALLFAAVSVATGLRCCSRRWCSTPGSARSWDLLIRYPIEDFSDYQSLPFPLLYDGRVRLRLAERRPRHDRLDPVASRCRCCCMIDLAAVLVRARARRSAARTGGTCPLAVFAIGMAHYLITRPDAFHVGAAGDHARRRRRAWILADACAEALARARGRCAERARLALVPAPVVALRARLARGRRRCSAWSARWRSDMVPVDLDVADGVRELPVYNCSLPGAARSDLHARRPRGRRALRPAARCRRASRSTWAPGAPTSSPRAPRSSTCSPDGRSATPLRHRRARRGHLGAGPAGDRAPTSSARACRS